MTGSLASPRRYALYAVSALVTTSTAVAFGESYRALFLWASRHDVPSGWAFIWPAMLDVFVAVGELALFVGLVDQWSARHRAWAWAVTFGGLAASIAANVGHVGAAQWTDRLTAAVPPVAAFVALTVGLGVLKRVVSRAAETSGAELGGVSAEQAGETDLTADRHRAVLEHAESDAQRVRYALKVIGPDATQPQVGTWLTEHGHPVNDTNMLTVFRRIGGKQADTDPPGFASIGQMPINGNEPDYARN